MLQAGLLTGTPTSWVDSPSSSWDRLSCAALLTDPRPRRYPLLSSSSSSSSEESLYGYSKLGKLSCACCFRRPSLLETAEPAFSSLPLLPLLAYGCSFSDEFFSAGSDGVPGPFCCPPDPSERKRRMRLTREIQSNLCCRRRNRDMRTRKQARSGVIHSRRRRNAAAADWQGYLLLGLSQVVLLKVR